MDVCEGDCEKHRGDVRLVHVADERNKKDWGTFYYCDEAVDIDTNHGLNVKELK